MPTSQSDSRRPQLPADHHAAVFSLEAGQALRDRVCARLGLEAGRHEERDFEDGEHKIRPLESVRGRDVYVVQSLYGDAASSVNDKLVRTLFLSAALSDAGAERVTVVAPYLCYSRKDRRTKPRDPVSSRYVASLVESVGVDRVVTVDVHNPAAFENAFRVPTVHLTAAPAFVDAFVPLLGDGRVAVVSPDAGGVKRAEHFRQELEARLDRPVGFAFLEKFRSEGVLRGGTVVGDVDGRAVVILDDLISSGTTLVRAARACREQGASSAFAAATHGVFSSRAAENLADDALDRVVITNSVPPRRRGSLLAEERLDLLDIAPLVADAICRLHTSRSIVELTDT